MKIKGVFLLFLFYATLVNGQRKLDNIIEHTLLVTDGFLDSAQTIRFSKTQIFYTSRDWPDSLLDIDIYRFDTLFDLYVHYDMDSRKVEKIEFFGRSIQTLEWNDEKKAEEVIIPISDHRYKFDFHILRKIQPDTFAFTDESDTSKRNKMLNESLFLKGYSFSYITNLKIKKE